MSTSVEINYCVPCGHLDRAIDVQRSILSHFGQRVDGVRLSTADKGTFTIDVDGERIYDKKTDAFDLDKVITDIEARVG